MADIQDIFNSIQVKRMSPSQSKAFFAIRKCRTASMGSHVDHCDRCGHKSISYNSCRNRHCPICQNSKQQEWVQAQMSKLLPTHYFHIVFTIPHELNTIAFQNQELIYSILIKSAGKSLMELAMDDKHLGASIGVTSVLHTWGQNLSFHPHVHCIVPGGGLSKDNLRFIQSSKKFFLPVKALSRKFRGKFLSHLKEAWNDGKVKLFGNARELGISDNFFSFIDRLYKTEWVVYCKKPFKSPSHVVNYLGRYTHRVAISNSRIEGFDGTNVTFKWKDYKDRCKIKLMTIPAPEFVRRFLLHGLPPGFMKIRHYGILSSRNTGTKLLTCIILAGSRPHVPERKTYMYLCPICGGNMMFTGIVSNAYESS
jgi:hypothetical protein